MRSVNFLLQAKTAFIQSGSQKLRATASVLHPIATLLFLQQLGVHQLIALRPDVILHFIAVPSSTYSANLPGAYLSQI